MDKKIYYTQCYDLYEGLLTDNQKEYFKLYYFDDLTILEISLLKDVTKSFVSKQLKVVTSLLDEYEAKLKFLDKFKKIEEILKNDEKYLKEIQKIWED